MTKLSLEQVFSQNSPSKSFAFVDNCEISQQQFLTDVYSLAQELPTSTTHWAIYQRCSYRFAVGFFALLLKQKHIIIPGDNNPATLSRLSSQVDAFLGDFPIENSAVMKTKQLIHTQISILHQKEEDQEQIAPVKLNATVTIFTSGSSGEPKAITKQLNQLTAELNALQQDFGHLTDNTAVFATVSHQHIYGLLFKLLWPICTQRPFYSQQVIDFSEVFHVSQESQQQLCWVASPAHLKRLQTEAPWQIAKDKWAVVFSSGGPLPFAAAQKLQALSGKLAHEIYGSSETGGIAQRQQLSEHSPWTALTGITIQQANNGSLMLKSPHLDHQNWQQTDDGIELIGGDQENSKQLQFRLTGRLDRIIKLEEKRLSLAALEAASSEHPWIAEAYAIVIEPKADKIRQTLCIACALTELGQAETVTKKHVDIVKVLKKHMEKYFEASLIPRKWRFLSTLPVNSQAKIDKIKILTLFE